MFPMRFNVVNRTQRLGRPNRRGRTATGTFVPQRRATGTFFMPRRYGTGTFMLQGTDTSGGDEDGDEEGGGGFNTGTGTSEMTDDSD